MTTSKRPKTATEESRPLADRHEAFGLLRIGRHYGGAETLFASPLRHHAKISLSIRRAIVERDLSREWIYGREELIEVDMTAAQFAQAITSLNQGDGVPCTLRYVAGERMADPPAIHPRELAESEFQKKLVEVASHFDSDIAVIRTILEKKSLNKTDRQALLEAVLRVKHVFTNHVSHMASQFTEALDGQVYAGKAELEAVFATLTRDAGNAALAAGLLGATQLPQLTDGGHRPPPKENEQSQAVREQGRE